MSFVHSSLSLSWHTFTHPPSPPRRRRPPTPLWQTCRVERIDFHIIPRHTISLYYTLVLSSTPRPHTHQHISTLLTLPISNMILYYRPKVFYFPPLLKWYCLRIGFTNTSKGSISRSGNNPNSVQKNIKCLKHVFKCGAICNASSVPKKLLYIIP